MLPLLLLAFIVVPLAELAVIIRIGGWLGVAPTIVLLLVDSLAGAVLLRYQGRAAWRRFQDALRRGRMPGREVLDGVLVVFGGALLLTPGFLTDLLGLACLVPATRALLRRVLVRRVTLGLASAPGRVRRPGPGPVPGDVDGTAREVDPRRLP